MSARPTRVPDRKAMLRRTLMSWYQSAGRHDLPWRRTRDPYAVLVSEVMLQQTQVERVISHYIAWMERWPTVASIASAPVADVIRAWAGLGYNRRAIALQLAASMVVDRPGGSFPRSPDLMRALPGVGPYTANAVASFAFGQRVAVVDTNVGRVVARALLGISSGKESDARSLHEAALSLLPARDSRSHNLALMDLGAMVCAARRPACGECPITETCEWRRAGFPAPPQPRHRSLPFESTARYARGRIVDALRASTGLTGVEIQAILPPEHAEDADRYLASLNRDGLVEFSEGSWSLPAEGTKLRQPARRPAPYSPGAS